MMCAFGNKMTQSSKNVLTRFGQFPDCVCQDGGSTSRSAPRRRRGGRQFFKFCPVSANFWFLPVTFGSCGLGIAASSNVYVVFYFPIVRACECCWLSRARGGYFIYSRFVLNDSTSRMVCGKFCHFLRTYVFDFRLRSECTQIGASAVWGKFPTRRGSEAGMIVLFRTQFFAGA